MVFVVLCVICGFVCGWERFVCQQGIATAMAAGCSYRACCLNAVMAFKL